MAESKDVLRAAHKALQDFQVKGKRHAGENWDFANWMVKHLTVKRGGKQRKYSFEGYEPYLFIVNNLHRFTENWFLKGTQIGFSTMMVGWNLYLPYWRGFDCGYALPDKVMTKPFMKTRFGKEQLANNQTLAGAYTEHETEMYYDCGANFVYFLGANVLSEALSRPMEQISLDEVTIINKDQIEMIEERLDAASFGQFNAFAREIYPGGPADVGYQSGRQNVYIFKCPACNHEQNLEELFYQSSLNKEEHPKCIKLNGLVWEICCESCQAALNRQTTGRWVPKFPSREINSYRLPQIIFTGMDLQRFMSRWLKSRDKKSKRAKLHSSGLAIPDAGDLQRINRETLIKLKRNYAMARSARWTIGGMDMGDTCWAVFADFQDDVVRTIWWEQIDADRVFEVVSQRLVAMNTMKFVIDGMPLTTEARKLAYAFPDQVVLNYYRGQELKEDEREHAGRPYPIIEQDREQALDSYCDLFTPENPKIIFPARVIEADGREIDFEDSIFATHHLRGSQKDKVDDNKLGKEVVKFKKHIPNHFFHAGNYLATAMALLAREEGGFSGTVPIFGSFIEND